VLKKVGHMAKRERVENFFVNHPDLININWFRNDQWSQNQKKKNAHHEKRFY